MRRFGWRLYEGSKGAREQGSRGAGEQGSKGAKEQGQKAERQKGRKADGRIGYNEKAVAFTFVYGTDIDYI